MEGERRDVINREDRGPTPTDSPTIYGVLGLCAVVLIENKGRRRSGKLKKQLPDLSGVILVSS